ncbi:ABC transporter substrate-binding protein [Phytohalomonas tamaricis]|uniref:ABC transporter substrate-binding protein n=1 Tax=Phytohalomonas tamaricis TaxID=2081032 RepID=UPI000D0B6661|nr:ABC transporter substrate-binding protein [Phytohalomonas tamaricis]
MLSLIVALPSMAATGSGTTVATDKVQDPDPLAPPPLQSMSIMLDWYVNPTHGPLIVAQQKGFFSERGLNIKISTPADPSAPPKLVAAGREDLAISYQPQLHLQVDQGLPLVRVGTLIGTPLNVLMVRDDSNIHSIADLKGKTVGYSVGGVEEVLLDTMLKHSGLSLNDVKLVNVNFSLTPALISRKVDAVTGAFRNFELAQMEQEGVKGRPFFVEEEGVPNYDELILVANNKTLIEKKALIARFLDAIEDATMWIINHPDEGWDTFKSYDPVLDNEVNKKAWYASIPRFALRPAAMDARRYLDFEAFLFDRGIVKKRASLEKLAVDINALPSS